MIQSILVDSTSIEELKCSIYDRIYSMAMSELESIRFGVKSIANYALLEDLEDYLYILDKNYSNCSCTCSIPLELISSRISKLTNSSC